MPSARSQLEVPGGDGAALPLREGQRDSRGEGDPPDIFVSPPAAALPCRHCRFHASTAVSMPVLPLPGYAEGVGRGCQFALRMRRLEMKAG